MPTKNFYDQQTEQSEIKTEIVRKYFWAWAKVISKQVKKHNKNKIGYVDLFAGQGKYEDGSKSTPLLILEGAIRDNDLREFLVSFFNDKDPENCQKLSDEINNILNIKLLKHKPIIQNHQVDDSIIPKLGSMVNIPTLYFFDPWGYKGLSVNLMQFALQGWGCDCMFFFNYNRINAALSNPTFDNNMNDLFGKLKAEKLRLELLGKSIREREQIIITGIKEVLKDLGGVFNIEYFFKDETGKKTSHFLIFASKNVLGYDIMKNIMANESSNIKDGVANFGYDPKDKIGQAGLFDAFISPIDDLADDLIKVFAGKSLSFKEIYYNHNVGKNYIERNYQDALRKLEEQKKIITNPSANERRKIDGVVTFGDNVLVTFP